GRRELPGPTPRIARTVLPLGAASPPPRRAALRPAHRSARPSDMRLPLGKARSLEERFSLGAFAVCLVQLAKDKMGQGAVLAGVSLDDEPGARGAADALIEQDRRLRRPAACQHHLSAVVVQLQHPRLL